MTYEESKIQQSCITWFDYQYSKLSKVLISVPNGAKREVKTVTTKRGTRRYCPSAQKLLSEGMRPGAADLLLLVSRGRYGSLGIEMKTEDKGSVQSPSQKLWQKDFEAAGNLYIVCRSFDQFRDIIKTYLG